MQMALLFRAAVTLAVVKVLLALTAYVAGALTGTLRPAFLPLWVEVLLVLAYAAVGSALVAGGRQDRRATELGVYLLTIGTAFADVLLRTGHPLAGVSTGALMIHVDAFMPAFLWLFVRDFPDRAPLGWAFRLPARAARLSIIAGAVLVIANLLFDLRLLAGVPAIHRWLPQLSRMADGSMYWPMLSLLMLPAGPVLVERSRHVGPGDRRRIMLFVVAVVAGLTPISVYVVLLATSAAWRGLLVSPAFSAGANLVVVIGLLSVPFTTAYAVLVARVVDLRLIVRSALQYALARYSVLALIGLPCVLLAWFVYWNRFVTVQELLFGRFAVFTLLGAALVLTALALRRNTLHTLDRRFFREHYDAQQILTGLVEASRRADSTERLATLLASEVDRALHLDRIAVLVRNDQVGQFVSRDGATRPLSCESMVARLLGASDEPLDLEPDNPRSVLRRLDDSELGWIADGGFRLLVPLRATDGSVIGVLALGEKKSELAYSVRDRQLLAAVGASGGLYLENRREARTPRSGGSPGAPDGHPTGADVPAQECPACALVYEAELTTCECGAALVQAPVPKLLANKFRLERRIGTGGMSVVYRAYDLALGRTVAIKALPLTGAKQTWRLRREARAMALVSHENLALIFGAESWHGRPLLVEEYLAGGTLADRLARGGPLPAVDVLTLGLVLSQVLESLHGAELLHRDLKPSNIGFTGTGTPKLLDFGLAQLLTVADSGSDHAAHASSVDSTTSPLEAPWHATRHGIGTPAYMAPEALNNEEPGASFDLWSLAVLMFESLTGVNPYRGETILETLARIERRSSPDLRRYLPGCRRDLAEFFMAALAGDRRRRPPTAREFGRQLSVLLQAVAAL
jgi:tRNA A-37 threonylcarbamoyl transferase component Bud32